METPVIPISRFLRREWFLAFSVGTTLAFFLFGGSLFAWLPNLFGRSFIFLWLFTAIMGSALSVVRHADHLASRLGEPYGTLILTLSVTFIEVASIAAVMLHGANNPTLARDTLFAVVMIVLNLMVGLSLLVGSWRHREQHYNLQGANSYLGVIIPLVVLSLILPDFTRTTPGPTLAMGQEDFLVVASLGLYTIFLVMQVGRHRGYFALQDEPAGHGAESSRRAPLLPHTLLLILYMAPVVFLAEQFAHPVDYFIETLNAPAAWGGVIMAILVATPEALGAVRAATANHLQRSINIFLGSVLSTIGLTIPAMVVVNRFTGHSIILGLGPTDTVMLLLTLAVSVVTFASGRTNIIQGAVHLCLFAAYLMLLFQS